MNDMMEELVIHGVPEWNARRRKVPIPKPGPDEVQIKVEAVGLNPKDWKYTEDATEAEALNAGDDVAGAITAVGSAVTSRTVGERVAGLHRLGEPGGGGYAQYATVPASTTFRLPANVPSEAGCTVPLAATTAAISLFQALGLPAPPSPDGPSPAATAPSAAAPASATPSTPVLIYGASSAVGAYAVQLAALSGLSPIIAVAGSGAEFVRSLGAATHVVDRRGGDAAHVAGEIRKALGGQPLRHALDAVGMAGSWAVCGDVLAPEGRLDMTDWGNVLDWDEQADAPGPNAWEPSRGVKLTFTLVSSAHGVHHDFISAERAERDRVFAEEWFGWLGTWLGEGRVKAHPHEAVKGGLDGVLKGVLDLKDGKVVAKKLVARIADTPGL